VKLSKYNNNKQLIWWEVECFECCWRGHNLSGALSCRAQVLILQFIGLVEERTSTLKLGPVEYLELCWEGYTIVQFCDINVDVWVWVVLKF
jgi:hypothetical protein